MLQEQPTGKVFDIQAFSVQDGPGIRTTVFLKGCHLRCPWCHSPESQQFYTQLSWISMRCIGAEACGHCVEACPKGAVQVEEEATETASGKRLHLVRVDRALCDNCGACTAVCYPKALYLCGEDMTADQVVERVSGDIPFYQSSGGGVTISGGEALCQPGFVLAVLRRLKEKGLHTAVDTAGDIAPDVVRGVMPYTDLFLYDLKHMDSACHKAVVGVPNERILSNAALIAREGGKMQIRIPVIPGFNDSDENFHATGRFCREIREGITVVQLLPFHSLGEAKYPRIGVTEGIFTAPPVPEARMEELRAILEGYGLPVTVH